MIKKIVLFLISLTLCSFSFVGCAVLLPDSIMSESSIEVESPSESSENNTQTSDSQEEILDGNSSSAGDASSESTPSPDSSENSSENSSETSSETSAEDSSETSSDNSSEDSSSSSGKKEWWTKPY